MLLLYLSSQYYYIFNKIFINILGLHQLSARTGPEYLAIKKLLKQLFLIAKWVIADQYTVFNLNAVRCNT